MVGGFNIVSSQLSSLYDVNNLNLANALSRIAHGKKVRNASDNFAGYSRAQALQTDINGYGEVKQDLAEAKGVAEMASELGDEIYDDLLRMKELATMYNAGGVSADDQAQYNSEFVALGASIMNTIDNNKYENTKVVSASTISTVYINPDNNTDTLAITFEAGDIITDVSAAAWDLDGAGGAAKSANDVQTEINKATTYLVKANKYEEKIDRQITITDNMIEAKRAAQSLITDIDEVEELNKATGQQIRQQATLAMIAQANLSQSYISVLYGGRG